MTIDIKLCRGRVSRPALVAVYGTHCGIWLNVVFAVADSISANLSAFVSVNFALFFICSLMVCFVFRIYSAYARKF